MGGVGGAVAGKTQKNALNRHVFWKKARKLVY